MTSLLSESIVLWLEEYWKMELLRREPSSTSWHDSKSHMAFKAFKTTKVGKQLCAAREEDRIATAKGEGRPTKKKLLHDLKKIHSFKKGSSLIAVLWEKCHVCIRKIVRKYSNNIKGCVWMVAYLQGISQTLSKKAAMNQRNYWLLQIFPPSHKTIY